MSIDQQPNKSQQSSKTQKALKRLFMQSHVFFYRLSGGILGGKAPDRAFLLLTTRGRVSGKERTTPLFYFPDGNRFIVIASNWGSAHHPQWWLNLQTNPHATVQAGRKVLIVTASQATGEEHERLWKTVTTNHKEFANYQKGTTRPIPVVILAPEG
jgi:F420H(2)-dependent quinone reductase